MSQINGGIITYISSVYNSLTKSEKKVADAVIKDPNKTIYSSISDFADEAQVGDTTILRFCRKIGFKSYQAFKLALAQEISNQDNEAVSALNVELREGDTLEELARKTLNINVCARNETLSLLDLKEVKKAVDSIVSAKKINFYGVGVSAITAQDAVSKLVRIGLNAACFTDIHMQMMQASLMSGDDVAVGISFSGSTKDTIDVLKMAKDTGAKIISITHHARSPITKISDIVLLHGSKEGPLQGGALSTKMSQLMVIDVLYNAIFMKLGSKAVSNKEITSKAVLEKLI